MVEPIRGKTRQRSALHLIARGLPRLARNAEHRTLARAGIADDIADPARRGDMVERAALLGGQVETASGRLRERKLAIAFGDRMDSARLERCCCAPKPPFGVDHRPSGNPNFAASIFAERDQDRKSTRMKSSN